MHTNPHPDMIHAITNDMFLDYLWIRLNAGKAGGTSMVVNLLFPDTQETMVATLENGTLNHRTGPRLKSPTPH